MRTIVTIAVVGLAVPTQRAWSQPTEAQELSEDEQRQVQIAERFVGVLEKSPRRGTALDRVYGHHVEFGTLDAFIASLRDRVRQSPEDGIGWMLLGLFESQRGQDANAIDAFVQAEKFRPEDALASYYLGQSQLLLGQPEAAVQSFERAIARQPQRADLLEIFQQLGRVHQRAQRDAEALQVWTRLEEQFPDDPRVQEQIAVTLVEEGKYDLALPRYEQLAKSVTDDYRKTMFLLEAAELKVRTSKRDAGIADLEHVLANLNPESWLHREVRRRIEDIFLRSGDQDGLVKYYEKWIGGHPEDVDAMSRVSRFLVSSARMPEAMKWMEQALKLAPRRFELRKAFIAQLVDDQRYTDAIQQYQLLSRADPGNPDVLRDWGKLVLKDKSLTVEQRQAEATRVWNEIVANKPQDALTAAQAADLFRQANLHDRAIALYEQAITLAPADPQYREYLGEYFHILKRPDDALATWKQIAEGPQHTALNVARLAEVYQSFGYMREAVEQIAEACRLEPKDFALQLRSADYHARAEQYDPALTYVEAAHALAANAEEHDAVIAQRIDVLQSAKRLEEESDALAARLAPKSDAVAEDWHLLARYLDAERRWARATEAIEMSLTLDPQSITALTTAARIAESSGDLSRAADLNRKLAEVDRRSRGDHLMNVARIAAQLGRTEEALQAGRDLIVSAPGNTDHYEFYAQLCFQLGKLDEGLDTLRKAVRINPSEPSLILALGNALSQQFRTDEAIEVYWRAFEKTEEVEEKTALTEKLTDLYLQINQFDKLVERFERDRREEDQRRDMTICLAQAHASAGDNGTARSELESLLSQETRDTNLLQQISKLCEGGGDFDGAIEYQRQLAAIAPGHETEHRLATLLQRAGDADEAAEIFLKLTRREEDPVRLMRSIDSLLSQGSYESVLAVVEPLLSEQRDDWELLYRQGVAWANLEKPSEAQQSFRRILDISTPLDAYGRAAEERYKRELAKAKSDSLRGLQSNQPQRRSPLDMALNHYEIKSATGLQSNQSYSSGGTPTVWTPDVYGVARMAAYGWLLRYERELQSGNKESATSFVQPIQARAEAPEADRNDLYDWLFIESLRDNYDSIFQIARRMAQSGGKEEQQFFLQSLTTRSTNSNSVRTSSSTPAKKEPLSSADLDLMLSCYENLNQQADDAGNPSAIVGAQVVYSSNGQMYVSIGGNWIAVSGGVIGGNMFLGQVAAELELAGREAQAQQLIAKVIDEADTAGELTGAMQLVLSRDEEQPEPESLRGLYERWTTAARGEIHTPPATSVRRSVRNATRVNDPLAGTYHLLTSWIGVLGPDEEHARIVEILNPALDISVEVLKAQRAERSQQRRPASSSSSNYANGWSIQYQYGKEHQSTRITYPTPGEHATTSQITLLRAAYEVLKRNRVSEDLIANARQRVEQADDDHRMYERLMLAYLLWWEEQTDDAVEQLKRVAEQLPEDQRFQLELAQAQQAQGDLDGALTMVDAVTPRDQKLLQQRELLALSLSERLGDIDRARQAAERLFGLRLSTAEQLELATAMRRLGMLDLAESIMARVQRQSGQQAASLQLLMVQYQGQGQTELAQQIAHRILRTTQSPLIGQSNSTYNPAHNSSSRNSGREQALRTLQQSGGLKPMIERLEARIEKSPESLRLYQQLIELYQTSNERDKLSATLLKAVAVRPDDVSLQYQLATHYEQSGRPKEACDAYLAILKLKPRWITDDLYSVRRVFDQAQRTVDLAKAFETMDLKQLGHPYYLIDIVQSLMRDEKNLDLGVSLFERIVEEFPTYRGNIISQFNDSDKLWQNDRIYALGKQLLTPTAEEIKESPWQGVNQIDSYGSDGQASSYFSRILDGVSKSGRQDDLEQYLQEQCAQHPNWLGGQMMLALIQQKQGDKDAARERIAALLPTDEKELEKIPSQACWIIGQELDQHEATRPVALKLLEIAVQSAGSSSNQVRYSPVPRLVKLYQTLGRPEDARDILLQNLRPKNLDHYDQDYQQAMVIGNKFWAAEQLQSINQPLDALLLFQELSSEETNLSRAASYDGESVDGMRRRITSGLAKSLEAISQADPDEAVTRLLSIDDKRQSGEPLFDLLLTVPNIIDVKTKPTDRISSRFGELLLKIAASGTLRENVRRRLTELQQEHPADLSLAVTRVLLADDASRTQDLEALAQRIKEHPLDEIPEGRRPNTRQRRAALGAYPLWLVARDSLANQTRRDTAKFLAEQALIGARRQVDSKYAAALLMEWGRQSLQSGDKAEAELRWTQLLEIVTERPGRKPANGDRKTSARGHDWSDPAEFSYVVLADESAAATQPRVDVVPPLTMSQFRLATRVAVEAAKAEMPQLSQRAVRELLAGGLPVPDVSTNPSSSTARLSTGAPSSSTDLQAGSNAAEQLVAQSLLEIVQHWNKPDYDPQAVYELLLPVIFPPARPKEILLFADSRQLDAAQYSNAGQVVIDWADRAKQLEDLATRIGQRQPTGPSEIPARVLLINIELKRDNQPAAREQLQKLLATIEKTASEPLATLACHAALPAANHPELAADAMRIVRTAVQLRAQASAADRNNDPSLGQLQLKLLDHLAAQGELEVVSSFFQDYLQARQSHYSRYGGDYGLYMQWRDWASIAQESAKLGSVDIACDYLGRAADFTHSNYSRPDTGMALAAIVNQVRRRPIAEQYALWRDWTLPTESRRTVRLLVDIVQPNNIPAEFLPQDQAVRRFPDRDVVSNATELLDAAAAAGRLDELRPLVERAHREKVPNAEFLWPLLLVRLGDVETATPVLNALAKEIKTRNETQNNQPSPEISRDYLVYHVCLQDERFGALYATHHQKLREALRNRRQTKFIARMELDYGRFLATAAKVDLTPLQNSRLKAWVVASTGTVPTDGVKPWWISLEGRLVHLGGPGEDALCLAAPLTGDFAFTTETVDDNFTEADAGYNGLLVESLANNGQTQLTAIGKHESVRHPSVLRRPRPAVNQITIRVQNGTMSYWLNNQLVHSETVSGTSPWLMLATDRARQSSFQRLRITGQPEIPEQVELVAADRMDGWNSSFYSESQPRHRFMARTFDSNSSYYRQQQEEPTEFDWRATDGVLHGRAFPDAAADAQSWIYYHRPLQSGESWSYEFRYEPGQTHVHPTLGRIAYQLTPEGVVEHWITRPEWDDTICGVPANNEFISSERRRGPPQLPLRPGEWNAVTVALDGDTLSIELNGTQVYEATVQPEPDARFGLFHWKREAVAVREARLTGPWREMFASITAQNLLASDLEPTTSQRRILGGLIQENLYPLDALAVAMRSRELPDEDAYDLLKAWVLSGPDHEAIRLYYEHLPYQSIVEISAQAELERSGPLDAGEVVAPAIDLVNLAHRLGRLDELAREVAALQVPARPIRQREHAAISALVSIAAGETDDALKSIKQLDAAVLAGLPLGARKHAFSPEGLVCRVAARQPRLVQPAWELAQRLANESRDAKNNRPAEWKDEAHDVLGDVERQLIRSAPVGVSGSTLTQWRCVPYLKPNHQFDGLRPSTWYADGGVLQHFGGGTWGQLYFQSPLRGKFEVVADRVLHDYREVAISYGMHAVGPKYDYKAVEVSKTMRNKTEAKPKRELQRPVASLSKFRMVVDGQRATTFMDGIPLHEQHMDRPPAPWLMLQASGPGYRPYLSNLRILGEPEIPDEIDLLDSWSTGFWRGDYYIGQFTGESAPDTATWRPEGDELRGNLVENWKGDALEGLLRYQRPLLEDGVISFEAFYFAGEYEVHPSLGGQAFLVQPDGVRRHELTGGAFERWGRRPDHSTAIEGAAPKVPLKSNDWNAYTLELQGDRLTLSVNGEQVAQHTVGEPAEERFFGLFRFANQSKARVRNMRYRGDWPKTLPAVSEQQLAQGPRGVLPTEEFSWTKELSLDVRKPIAEINQGAFRINGAAEVIQPTTNGIRLKLATVAGQRKQSNITLDTPIEGDAEVLLDYEQFQATPVTSGWGNFAMLRVTLDDPTVPYFEIGPSLRENGQPQLRIAHRHTRLDGEMRYVTMSEPVLPPAGRLRLIRRGGVFYGLFAEPGSDVFRHVGSAVTGTGNIRRVEFLLTASDKDSTIDVVVKSLTVKSYTPSQPAAGSTR